MSRFRHPQLLGPFFVALLFFLLQPSHAVGQSCPLPESPRILGYIHLDQPPRLAENIHTVLAATGRAITSDQMLVRLSSLVGDRTGALIPSEGVMTIAWVRTDSGVYTCVVLPEVTTSPYLRDCLDQSKKEHQTVEGLTFIAPAPVFEAFEGIAQPLAALHSSMHPADISVYLSGELLREWEAGTGKCLDALGAPTLDRILVRLLGRKQTRTRGKGLLTPTAVGVASRLSLPARVLCEALAQVEAVHFIADPGAETPRLILNVAALPDTALARFFGQSEPKPNALVRFLPTTGAARAAVNLDGRSVATLIEGLMASLASGSETEESKAEGVREEVLEGIRGLQQPLALSLSSRSGADPCVVLTMSTKLRRSAESIRALLATTEWFPRAEGAGVPRVLGTGVSQLTLPSAVGRKKPKPRDMVDFRREVVGHSLLLDGGFERFPVAGFFATGTPVEAPIDQALLLACLTGKVLVLTPQFDELMGAVNRILHLGVRSDALLSQKTFLEGAHLYADIRPVDQVALAWTQSDVIQLTTRFADSRAQLAVGFTPAAFGGVFKVSP